MDSLPSSSARTHLESHPKPKAFVINGGVASGKEWISAIIKRDNIGLLIGAKTAGAFLGPEFPIAKNIVRETILSSQPRWIACPDRPALSEL